VFIDKVKELRNINQKLNGWLLAEARTSSESSTWKFLRASNSQRTQNRAEETNSPRSNQHRPQKVVTTSHRLMHSSLPIYTASSEFSWTVANHFLGCGPWEHFPTGAYTPQMLWRVISLAPLLLHLHGQDPEARIFLNYVGKVPIWSHQKEGDFSCDSTCLNWKSMQVLP